MDRKGAGEFDLQNFFSSFRLVGDSPAMSGLKKMAEDIASRRSTVMILGETGSGKEMLARFIHQNSNRSEKPFIPVDCSSLSDNLFESELFGHVKGAFTGASRDSLGFIRAADGGTLFLDEIGELSLHLQSKLLRVLQEKCVTPVGDFRPLPVDIRVVTATNRSLEDMVRDGKFRQDLYFRLNVVVLKVPALRERVSDVVSLANHFLKTQAELYDEQAKTISAEVVHLLERYSWPGNVRELSNVMEHAHVIAQGQEITVKDLPPRLQPTEADGIAQGDNVSLEDMERCTISKALKSVNFNKAAASRLLGINIQRLNRRITRLGINMPEAK
ncbi:MAG TPA: sigma-54 dependent transcriptional regulator [Tepidisphaeraceae bacterium]|nr:sigma-54 dependent transcriptional regulator [Tepidisphaeraceae bacterium]